MMDTLFEGYEAGPVVDDGLSADRRRTLRQRRDVASGVHPLTGGKARPDLGTCGECTFRQLFRHHDGTYPKCFWTPPSWSAERYETTAPPRLSHGTASDVRAWWPACEQFELGAPKVGPDAARWKP
ncbi:MAG TPA: hypothetical protein VIJ31_04030 [Acidothermaceae bacterium]